MSQDSNSFKNVAVLTGLTMLIGGAEISNADANTISDPTQTFLYSWSNFNSPTSLSNSLSFAGFDTSLGTLTQVEVQLNSEISDDGRTTSASVTLAGNSVGSVAADGNFNEDAKFTTSLSSFETASLSAVLSLMTSDGQGDWEGLGSPAGLTVTYTYTPVSATPLPATLPLFAGGLAGLGFTTWRRRRKQTAKE
jgi:hypothetical protein